MFIIIAGIIWSIFGYIPIATEVKGQLVNGSIELINSPESGILQELKVKKGDKISQGETIATIETFDTRKNKIQDVTSNVSGIVISTLPLGTKVDSKTHLAIIEKDDSSSQKSIFCLSSLEECQKIKTGIEVEIIASDYQEKFTGTVKDTSPLLLLENNSTNLSEKPLVPQIYSVIIQTIDNIKINSSVKEKLEKHPTYPVSVRVMEKHSPISFILPKS